MKKDFLVRFANDNVYYTRANIDLKKIKEPMIFPNEVFFTIDDLRVAIKRNDWEEIKKELTKEIMIVEHEGKIYETTISKPIQKNDLYYDCMVNEVKKCESFICFDPWALKMELKEEKLENEKID